MKREFILTSTFDKKWKQLHLTDDDLCELQNFIMRNPFARDIITGTGGASKLRFALSGKGKSGSIRVIFVDIVHKNRVYLLLCYAKSEQDNLTNIQKKKLESLIKILKGET